MFGTYCWGFLTCFELFVLKTKEIQKKINKDIQEQQLKMPLKPKASTEKKAQTKTKSKDARDVSRNIVMLPRHSDDNLACSNCRNWISGSNPPKSHMFGESLRGWMFFSKKKT